MALFLPDRRARLRGTLFGTAIGDALGLPIEGMTARSIARNEPQLDRFSLLGATGFVSDDTEQSALAAASLARNPRDRSGFVRAFRRALLGWFARLPWGIGGGTLRACVRIAFGMKHSGVRSAGNGAAMRAAIVGVFFADAVREERWAWVDALSSVTHIDERAMDGARYVAEVAVDGDVRGALAAVSSPALRAALERSLELAIQECTTAQAAAILGASGYVVCSVPLAAFVFARHGSDPDAMRAIREVIRAGGDTDTNAAIVGAWVGALRGDDAFPRSLVESLHDGPFGPTHLRALADDLAAIDERPPSAHYSWPLALARNVALFPVVLFHGVRVLLTRVRG
jgi:ADP-ribosylglycohydrolase